MRSDAITLRCVRLRSQGLKLRQIGPMVGLSYSMVGQLTEAILAADLAESTDEPEEVVRAAYWRTRARASDAGR